MYQNILFDLDGTLTDPKEGITKCVQYALKAFGIEADPDDLVDFIGPPLAESFQKYYHMNDEDALKAVVKYRERFSNIGIFENGVYPGIKELLAELKISGRRVALATSKPEIFAKRILDNYGLSDYFDVIVGSEMNGRRTDKAEVIEEALRQLGIAGPEEKQYVLMVGDRLHDMIGAVKNQIDGLGVYYGYAHEGELEAAGASATVRTVPELRCFLENH
ncbi:MAG: HAD-IA family hydrolase [Coprococcus sp.]